MEPSGTVDEAARDRFDALQYSFFSGEEDGTLDGGLEEGLTVPPDEGTLAEEFICCENYTDSWAEPRVATGASPRASDAVWGVVDRDDTKYQSALLPAHQHSTDANLDNLKLNEEKFLSVTELENHLRSQTLPPQVSNEPNGALTVAELEAQLQYQARESLRLGSSPNGECTKAPPNHLSNYQTIQSSTQDRFLNISQDPGYGGPMSLPPGFQHHLMHEKNNFAPGQQVHIPAQRPSLPSIPPGSLRGQGNQFSYIQPYGQEEFSTLQMCRSISRRPCPRPSLAYNSSLGLGISTPKLMVPEGFHGQRLGNSAMMQGSPLQQLRMDPNQRALSEGHRLLAARFLPREDVQPQFKCMSQAEIGRILSFQAQNLQFSNPYIDDYYFQAHAKKHQHGLNRLAPAILRIRDPWTKQGKTEVRFADLEGLGKIPFSNLRTPRPLIDFADEKAEADKDNGGEGRNQSARNVKPLHMEQMLHARKVIEDCMCVLLDVDDIDRTSQEDFGLVDLSDLAKRRADLVCSVVSAFSRGSGTKERGKGCTNDNVYMDGIFLRLMSLVKGRTMYAKLLSTLVPPPLLRNVPHPDAPSSEPSLSDACCQMCWVVFRNVRALFGPPTWITKQGLDLDQSALTAATSTIATKVLDVISTLESARDVSLSFEALAKGDLHPSDRGSVTPEDLLLPFLPPNHNPLNPCPPWLETVLVSLLLKSKEIGLENDVQSLSNVGSDTARRWQWAFDILYRAVTAHLQVLVQVHRAAKAQNQPEALTYARGLLGKELLTATLTLCNRKQRNEVKEIVSNLTE